MKVVVDAWRGSWQWLKKPGSRKSPIGVWARSAGRYVRWRAPATIMIIGSIFHTLMVVISIRKLSNLSTEVHIRDIPTQHSALRPAHLPSSRIT